MRFFSRCMFVCAALTVVTACKGGADSSPEETDSVEASDASSRDDTQPDTSDRDSTSAGGTDTQPAQAPEPPELGPGPWYGCLPGAPPPGATVVSVFDLADHYFNPEDRRNIDARVEFPESGSWQRIDLRVELSCPEDGDCDNWDRFANVMLVEDPGGEDEKLVEIERYITPYNVPMCFQTDVTGFASTLRGEQTIRSFIDTWVGPHEAIHGHGWRVSLDFIFYEGQTDHEPSQVIQLWPYGTVKVGDPADPIEEQLATRTVEIPSDITRAELRLIATGHGQGNAGNCAEFCRLQPSINVNDTASLEFNPWRFDCAKNPNGDEQAGTWSYNRLGWCPGAYVTPEVVDITDSVEPGKEAVFKASIVDAQGQTYTNTCRPGAGDEQNLCQGCVFDENSGNCDYDGGAHTAPVVRTTAQLLLYR